jgi:hypothetical protein
MRRPILNPSPRELGIVEIPPPCQTLDGRGNCRVIEALPPQAPPKLVFRTRSVREKIDGRFSRSVGRINRKQLGHAASAHGFANFDVILKGAFRTQTERKLTVEKHTHPLRIAHLRRDRRDAPGPRNR